MQNCESERCERREAQRAQDDQFDDSLVQARAEAVVRSGVAVGLRSVSGARRGSAPSQYNPLAIMQ
jgi:hypothetical protein